MTICGYCGGPIGPQGIEHIGMNAWFCSRVCADKAKESYGPKVKALHSEVIKIKEAMQEINEQQSKDPEWPANCCTYCGRLLGEKYIPGRIGSYCSSECFNNSAREDNVKYGLKQGVKYDQDKLPYHLISIPAMDELAKRLQHGAQKYSDRNWEKGLEYNRCYRAALNHLYAFWRGEDIDADSGLSHLSGALCNLMFLCHFESDPFYETFDNRPVAPGKSKLP